MKNLQFEKEIISLFIVPSKKKRLLWFLDNGKRDEVIRALNSPEIFDERYVPEISGHQRNVEDLIKLYKENGMGERVYIMSENYKWDGNKYQMSYIIDQCLAQCIDTLGYGWKTKSAFYEWHHSEFNYFLKHKRA